MLHLTIENDKYIAKNGDKIIGFCEHEINGDDLLIKKLEGEDDGVFDGLLRATCDYALQKKCMFVTLSGEIDQDRIEKIGLETVFDGKTSKIVNIFLEKKCNK